MMQSQSENMKTNSKLSYLAENATISRYWQESEVTNGRLAMIGFFALIHNYLVTGWIIPGIY